MEIQLFSFPSFIELALASTANASFDRIQLQWSDSKFPKLNMTKSALVPLLHDLMLQLYRHGIRRRPGFARVPVPASNYRVGSGPVSAFIETLQCSKQLRGIPILSSLNPTVEVFPHSKSRIKSLAVRRMADALEKDGGPDASFEGANFNPRVMTFATRMFATPAEMHEKKLLKLQASIKIALLEKECGVTYTAIGRP